MSGLVSELTCLGAYVSCGCCTPEQEGWSPHLQEPETNREDQIVIQKHIYCKSNCDFRVSCFPIKSKNTI